MIIKLHPICKECNSEMFVARIENGYRIWKCPNKCIYKNINVFKPFEFY